jgi:uncharacterized surface protein with fasciclin (FAS1) repeats
MRSVKWTSVKAFFIAALFLSGCAGATAVPTSTSSPVSTEAPTSEATSMTEATATTEVTSEATSEMTATTEATGEATATTSMSSTAEVTGTAMVTATVEVSGTAEAMGGDIIDTAMAAPEFSTLVRALNAAGLVDQLKQQGPFTVFVPSDEAFSKMSSSALTSLLNDRDQLTKVLTYHVVPGLLTADDLADKTSVTTLNGADLKVSMQGGDLYVNDAKVIRSITATNGVIHVIDSVLTPPAQ